MKTNLWQLSRLSWVLIGTTGCAADFDSMCRDMEACFGGNDKDIAACVESYEGLARRAEVSGCRSEYEAYVECRAPLMTCHSVDVSSASCTVSADCATWAPAGIVGICVGTVCDFKGYGVDSSSGDFLKCDAERIEWFECEND